jgi:mannose-6-phosphate isomerase-like protein (cupin superfamily)
MTTDAHLVVEPGGGERLRFLDNSALLLKSDGDETGGSVAFYEYVAEPSAKGSPQHVHHGHDETFYIVDGSFEFTLGSRSVPAGPGAFLSVPRGHPHAFRNAGDSQGRIVGTFSPAHFSNYFRELALIIEKAGAGPDMPDWIDLYGRYDTTFYNIE